MELGEARTKLAAVVTEITEAGFELNGFDDGCIYLRDTEGNQTWVDPEDPDDRPDDTRGRRRYAG